ncbi:pilin [Synechococcus phage ACG-2014f]|uniref:Pilin n=1 Tax=Synechococcus phage ACG-2014f TaxID=1493511 RepID=A0A0E3FQD0_9CAUD|nr:pilin [Synechococcus phage ACG-2014f]AIX31304.1 pilin [Synechococcus phage ACG-2014f]
MKIQQSMLRRLAAKKGKKQNGFTLIELMVVIAIVGILSAVGLPELLKAQDRAKDSVAKQEVISAAKECSIWTLGGKVGDIPDGADFTAVTVNDTCTSVTAVSESSDATEYTVDITSGVPGSVS